MGFLDRLEDIVGGAWDMATAPIGIAYDLIRSVPDPNITVGNAFGGGFERFIGGLARISQATGISALGTGVAEVTGADDVLGRLFQELELYYSSGYQEQIGRTPYGLHTLTGGLIEPGQVSIQRGLGTVAGAAMSALPWGEPSVRGVSQAFNRARYTSPGRMAIMSFLGAWDRTPEELEQLYSNPAFNFFTGSIDAVMRWVAQPEVIAGKAVARGVRARWHPTVNQRIDRFQKEFGMDAAVPPWLNITPRTGLSREQVASVISRDLSVILRDPETGHLPGDFNTFVNEVVDRITPATRLSKEGFSFLPLEAPDEFTPMGPLTTRIRPSPAGGITRNPYSRNSPALSAYLGDQVRPVFEGEMPLPPVEAGYKASLGRAFESGEIPFAAEFGGAVNSMVTNARGQHVYHVTRRSNAEAILGRGIRRPAPLPEVGPMADDIVDDIARTFGEEFRHIDQLEIPPDLQTPESLMRGIDLDSVPGADPRLRDVLGEILTPDVDDMMAGRAGVSEAYPEGQSVWTEIQSFFNSLDETTRMVAELATDRIPWETVDPEIVLSAVKRTLRILADEAAPISPLGKRILVYYLRGLVDDIRRFNGIGEPPILGAGQPGRNPAIYLLGEDELPEAYRYAAALTHTNPNDPAVILKLNPEGLPVIYDDFLNPFKPDPRSGLPSDASLITMVDAIRPEHIIGVEQVPGPLFSEERLVDLIRRGHAQYPDYLKPGGRVHERLFNPDATPIEPRDIIPFEQASEVFNTATYVYSTEGETAAVKFLKGWQYQQARPAGAMDLPTFISGHKSFQILLNELDGKDADWIRRVVFPEHPAGAVISSLLSEAKTYQERRLILLSCMGIATPEMSTLPAMTRARIKALQGDLGVLQGNKARAEAQRQINAAALTEDELIYLDEVRYKQMEDFVLGEIEEQTRLSVVMKWLDSIQKGGGVIREMPRMRRSSALAETIRSTTWFQKSALCRPIRSVIEKRPHQFINVHDPHADIQIVRQLEEARPLGIGQDRVKYYRERWMAATNESEKARIAHQMDNELVRAAARHAGLEVREIEELVKYASHGRARTGKFLESRRYAPEADMDTVRWYDADTGETVSMALPMFGTQLQNWIPLTDVRALISVSTRIRRVRMRLGRVPKEMMDSFYHLWKPAVLLRGGWPIRVVTDEQLRILARTGSLLRHLAAIETGEMPKWTGYTPGMTGAQRAAATMGLVTTVPVAAITRAGALIAKGAKALKLYDPQWYDDLAACGYERLASARAARGGPHEAIAVEFEKLIGSHEFGLMDNLISKGSGQWGTVTQESRFYGQAWRRALQNQLGRDPMVRQILETVKRAGYLREVGGAQAIRRSLKAWGDETGLFSQQVTPELLDRLSEFLYTLPEGIMDEAEFAAHLDTFFRYHLGRQWRGSTHVDNAFVDELAHDLARDMPQWRVGEFTTRAVNAGSHHGGWRLVHSGLKRTLKARHIEVEDITLGDMTDSIYAAYDHYAFGAPDPFFDQWPDFETFLDTYLASLHGEDAFGMASREIGDTGFLISLKDSILDKVGSWLPENPRVEFAPVIDPAAHIVRWLSTTDEGEAYAARLPWRSDLRKWAEDSVATAEYYTAGFDPALVDAALAKKVPLKLLESIDQSRRPPTIHSEIIDQVTGDSAVLQAMNEFLSTGFDLMGRLPTDTLSRQPFFKHMYANEMQRLRKTLESQGMELTEESFKWADSHARNYALGEVNKWLYNLAETSRFGAMMRWYLPFFPAWQEVLGVWAGLIRRDPSIIGRAMLLWRAPNKAGLITTDENGEEYITFRLSENMANKLDLTGWARFLATGGLRFAKTSFNLVLNAPLPGAGPPIQIPVNQVVQNKPELEEALRWLMPFGVKGNIWEILGSPLIRRTNSFIQGADGDKSFERDFYNILVWEDWRYRTGQRTDPPTYDEVTSEAQKLFVIRLGFNLLSPSQPIFDSPMKPYIDVYRALMETAGPDEADEIFLNTYGDELFGVTLSRTVSRTGIPPTVEAQVARRQFDDLIAKYPEYGRLIIGDDAAMGEFSTAAFVWQMSHPPSPDDPLMQPERAYRELTIDPETGRIEEVDRRLGWNEYIKLVDLIDAERRSRGLPNLKVREARDLATLKQVVTARIAEQYPAWWRDINERNDLDWANTIRAMRDIAFSPLMEDRPDLFGVRSYFTVRDAVLAELNRRKQTGGSSSLDASSNWDLAVAWESLVYSIIEDNVAFGPVYYRYLEGDPIKLRAELVSSNG